MKLSFIVCTYNRDGYIYQCLSCLAANSHADAWEIVLVDNNSTDRTATECQRFAADYPQVDYRYFLETQQGLSYARNRGMHEALGDWFVFLDDDAMVGADYVERLLGFLQQYPDAAAFGGQIVPFFEDKAPDWLNPWALGFVSALEMGGQVRRFAKGKFPIGANMGIARSMIARVGEFNTALGRTKNQLLGGEEKDIFLRMQALDAPIYYFPGIAVNHCIPPHRTTPAFIEKLGYGVGLSERLRTSVSLFSRAKRLFSELVKWGGTLVLWCGFALRGQPSKGNILILFRRNVTKGLLSK